MRLLKTDDVTQRRTWQIYSFLRTEPSAAQLLHETDWAVATNPQSATDHAMLLRANSNYFVMHALYSIKACQKLYKSDTAESILHSDNPIDLGFRYKLGAPIQFH